MGSLSPFIDAHTLHYIKFPVNMYFVHVGDTAMILFSCIVQPYSSHLPANSSHPFLVALVHTLRQWNKETFDYLLSFLSSPECVKMGIFLQSGYNLLTERSPVRRALFFTENTCYKISEDLWNLFIIKCINFAMCYRETNLVNSQWKPHCTYHCTNMLICIHADWMQSCVKLQKEIWAAVTGRQ